MSIGLLLAWQATSALAQSDQQMQRPRCSGVERRHVTVVKRIEGADRDLLWAGTSVHPEGFLLVEVQPEYPHLIRQLLSVANQRERAGPRAARFAALSNNSFAFLNVLEESDERINAFYSDLSGRHLMLTEWRFAHTESRLCIYEEFLNSQVGKAPATLALTAHSFDPGESALWKVTWIDEWAEIEFELYVEDRLLSTGKPEMSRRSILEIANSFANRAMAQARDPLQ